MITAEQPTVLPYSGRDTKREAGPFARLLARIQGLFEVESGHERLLAMEGLRGFAVSLVFFTHYCALFQVFLKPGSISHSASAFMANIGHTGVDLFFVLSGYLIYGAALKPNLNFARFLKRRTVRIYPAFLVVLVLYLVLSFVFPTKSKIPDGATAGAWYVLQNLLFLPGIFDIEPLIVVAWSLSYEFLFYLALPLAVVLLRLRERNPGFRVTLFLSIAGLYAAYCCVGPYPRVRLIMFVSGMVLYEALRNSTRNSARRDWSWIVIGALAVVFYSFHVAHQFGDGNRALVVAKAVLLFGGFYLLTLISFQQGTVLNRFYSFSWIRYLGNMSYSYYLTHCLVINAMFLIFRKFVPGSLGALAYWCGFVIVYVATLAVSTILFAFVEKPLSLNRRPSSQSNLAQSK